MTRSSPWRGASCGEGPGCISPTTVSHYQSRGARSQPSPREPREARIHHFSHYFLILLLIFCISEVLLSGSSGSQRDCPSQRWTISVDSKGSPTRGPFSSQPTHQRPIHLLPRAPTPSARYQAMVNSPDTREPYEIFQRNGSQACIPCLTFPAETTSLPLFSHFPPPPD